MYLGVLNGIPSLIDFRDRLIDLSSKIFILPQLFIINMQLRECLSVMTMYDLYHSKSLSVIVVELSNV